MISCWRWEGSAVGGGLLLLDDFFYHFAFQAVSVGPSTPIRLKIMHGFLSAGTEGTRPQWRYRRD